MTTVDDYLSHLAPPEKAALQHIRTLVNAMVPGLTEGISYGMPAFKYSGKYLVGYAAFKDHLSLFPGGAPVGQLADKLTDYKTSKGTIQFTLDHPIPDDLLKEIVQTRLDAITI